MAPNAYIDAAERILSGESLLYGKWVATGEPVDWNCDPVSGIRAPLVHGPRLDYRDGRLVGSARNIWELNRHFQLVTLAQAWALTTDERYRNGARRLVADWVADCPFPLGINWVSALEHGIRLINWYIAARLLHVQALDDASWLGSIGDHCAFIWSHRSRYSSANNHLIGEMAGLYVASVAWPCWRRSEFWRERAREALEREVVHQVHADGVSKEQTTGYQPFIVQFLVIAGLVGEAHGEPYSREYWSVVNRMLGFLRSVQSVGGDVPGFGDADEGMVFSLSANGRASLVGDLLGLADSWSDPHSLEAHNASATTRWLSSGFPRPANWPTGPLEQGHSFPDGGYYVLGRAFGQPDEVKLVMDAGPLGYLSIAAHGHADCLSFTLSIAGQSVLIDPGTYAYHEDAAWRDYFRGTRAHNTVTVDGSNQSEIGGPFMWLRRARPSVLSVELESGRQTIRASHDGYVKLPDPVTHIRQVEFRTAESIVDVIDTIEAKAAHSVERFWHFSPRCRLSQVSATEVVVTIDAGRLRCTFDAGTAVDIFEGSTNPRCGWFSPRFGELVRAPSLRLQNQTSGRVELRTRFSLETT